MKCSYCGNQTRWTEKFCDPSSMFAGKCGAPLHRPDCNLKGERGCSCPDRPFQDGEIDQKGKVFRKDKGWIKE